MKVIFLDEAGILNSNIVKSVSAHFSIHYCQNRSQIIQDIQKHKTSRILMTYSKDMDFDDFFEFLSHIYHLEKPSIFILSDVKDKELALKAYSAGINDWIDSEELSEVIMYKLFNTCNNEFDDTSFKSVDKLPEYKDFGNLKIDKDRYEIISNHEKLVIPRKEFEILWLLASEPGRVFRREEIKKHVWGHDVEVNDRTIDVHIRMLRIKLKKPHVITIKGVGYKFSEC